MTGGPQHSDYLHKEGGDDLKTIDLSVKILFPFLLKYIYSELCVV
jgi:hypothetical protein